LLKFRHDDWRHEGSSSDVSRSWSHILPRPTSAARRTLLYSFRTAVKLSKAVAHCPPLVADQRHRGCEDRAKLIIEPILNGWEIAEKLKSKSGYTTIVDIVERYQSQAEDRPATIRNNSSALRLIIRTVHGGTPTRRARPF
jgi:hypothetical protein